MGVAQMATELSIPSDLAEARRVQDRIEDALHAATYSEHDIFAVKLALEEALVNAIKHGNQMDPDKRVLVAYNVTAERFDIPHHRRGSRLRPGRGAPTRPTQPTWSGRAGAASFSCEGS